MQSTVQTSQLIFLLPNDRYQSKKRAKYKETALGNNYGSVKMYRLLSSVVCPQSSRGKNISPKIFPEDSNFRAREFYSMIRGTFFNLF